MKLMEKLHQSPLMPWLVWGLAAVLGLFTFLLQGSPSVMIPQLMKTYDIDVVKIGVLTSSFFYTYIILQIPSGIAVDLWGPRRILKICFLFCSLAIAWFAYSNSFIEGQISRMLMGAFSAPAIISALCLGSRWFKPALFTLIVALTEFLALSGGILGEAGLAKSVVTFGWRETMITVAVLSLILTFLTIVFIFDFPQKLQPIRSKKTFKEICHETSKNFKRVISIKKLWVSGIYAGLVFSIFPSFAALWGIPYFAKRYSIPVDQSALLASTVFLGACVGTLLLGWVSVYVTSRRPLMIWGSLLSFFLSLVMIYIPGISFGAMFLVVFLFGLISSTYALSFALADTYVTHTTKGVAMGFTNMLCILFGAPIFQPLIGFLLDFSCRCEPMNKINIYTHNDYAVALSVLPLSLLISFFLAFFIKESHRHPEDATS